MENSGFQNKLRAQHHKPVVHSIIDAQTISGLRCIFTLVATLFSHFAQYVSNDSLPSLFRSNVGEPGETGVGGLVVGVEIVILSAVLSCTLEGLFDIYRPLNCFIWTNQA